MRGAAVENLALELHPSQHGGQPYHHTAGSNSECSAGSSVSPFGRHAAEPGHPAFLASPSRSWPQLWLGRRPEQRQEVQSEPDDEIERDQREHAPWIISKITLRPLAFCKFATVFAIIVQGGIGLPRPPQGWILSVLGPLPKINSPG